MISKLNPGFQTNGRESINFFLLFLLWHFYNARCKLIIFILVSNTYFVPLKCFINCKTLTCYSVRSSCMSHCNPPFSGIVSYRLVNITWILEGKNWQVKCSCCLTFLSCCFLLHLECQQTFQGTQETLALAQSYLAAHPNSKKRKGSIRTCFKSKIIFNV